MSINAIAKKKLGFRNPSTGEVLIAKPLEYLTLPDWVKSDPLYQWAIKDGSLEVPKVEKAKVPKENNDGEPK